MSRPRILRGATLARLVECRARGATIAAIATEFGVTESTARRALRRAASRRTAAPAAIKIECHAKSRALLVAEAQKLGMAPSALGAKVLDLVLQGGLFAAVYDGG